MTNKLEDYAARMAKMVKVSMEALAINYRVAGEKLSSLDAERERLRSMCPHTEMRRIDGGCAEAESYDECLICGKQF